MPDETLLVKRAGVKFCLIVKRRNRVELGKSLIFSLSFHMIVILIFIYKCRKGKWDDMEAYDGTDVPDALDENDPNFDDYANESKYILSSTHGADTEEDEIRVDDRIVYGPLFTLQEFKIRLGEAIQEYFDSADADEVVRTIQEMRCKEYHAEVVKKAISLSLDKGPRERELISRLLTCLHPLPLDDDDVDAGFENLLDSLEDLSIDIPDAKVSLAKVETVGTNRVASFAFAYTFHVHSSTHR